MSRPFLRFFTSFITILGILALPLNGIQAATPDSPGVRIVQADGGGLVLEFNAPEYRVESGRMVGELRTRLSIPGAVLVGEPGKPALPVISALIGVPGDSQIVLETIFDDASPLTGQYDLELNAGPAPLAGDLQPGEWTTAEGADDSAGDGPVPAAPVRLASLAWLRDQRVARVEFSPFQYHPQRGMLTWHRRIQVAVRFQRSGQAGSLGQVPQATDSFETALRGALLNYEQAKAWRDAAPAGEIHPSLSQGAIASGPRYRIAVNQDGLYRLTCTDLQTAGMQIGAGGADPRTFRLSSQGQEVAISMQGEADGICDLADTLTFYGQKFYGDRLAERYSSESNNWLTFSRQLPDGSSTAWRPAFNALMAEKYTDENVYWLEAGGDPGTRMEPVPGDPNGSTAQTPQSYTATTHAERSLYRWTFHFQGEDTWFWDHIQSNVEVTKTYTTTLSALAGEAFQGTVRARLIAYSSNDFGSPDHWTRFTLNDPPTPLDEATWNGRSSYTFEVQVPKSVLHEGVNELHLTTLYDTGVYPTLINPDYYFDWFEIAYRRRFQAEGDQLLFPVEASGSWKYQVSGFSSNEVEVYDISSPLLPKIITGVVSTGAGGSYTARFLSSASAGDRLLAAAPGAILRPKSISFYSPPDLLSASNGADYIFITPSQFISGLQPLVNLRRAQGLRTKVVDIRDVYNQFNDGIAHPIAIKSFLAYAYAHWQKPAPAYILLVGDGHWNPKGFNPGRYGNSPSLMPPNLGWVDPWQGEVDDTNSLATFVGDDPLPDLSIARLPVNTTAELDAYVTKVRNYERSGAQEFQRRLLFVADDTPDIAGNFPAQADALIEKFMPSGWIADRVYLDDYQRTNACKNPNPNTDLCPAMNAAIAESLNNPGALLLTYFGHAAVQNWASESIWTRTDIASLGNSARLPVVLSMTCLDGYWIGPTGGSTTQGPSLIEEMVRAGGKGAVGAFSPGGLGVGTGHDVLAEGFYRSLFEAGSWELGQAAISAKLALYASGADYDLIHTFTIFGDPALHIASAYNGKTVYLPGLWK